MRKYLLNNQNYGRILNIFLNSLTKNRNKPISSTNRKFDEITSWWKIVIAFPPKIAISWYFLAKNNHNII